MIPIKRESYKIFFINFVIYKSTCNLQKDLSSWLHQIGLEEYKPNFRRNQIKTVRDMEALKSFTIKEIKEDLNITKPGKYHLQATSVICMSNERWSNYLKILSKLHMSTYKTVLFSFNVDKL